MHPVTMLQQGHGEIGIFGDGIRLVASGSAHRRCAPGADRPRHHRHYTEHIQSSPFEVLAGQVFQGLPSRPHKFTWLPTLVLPAIAATSGSEKWGISSEIAR